MIESVLLCLEQKISFQATGNNQITPKAITKKSLKSMLFVLAWLAYERVQRGWVGWRASVGRMLLLLLLLLLKYYPEEKRC